MCIMSHSHSNLQKSPNPTLKRSLSLSLPLFIPGFENTATVFDHLPEIQTLDRHKTLTEGAQDMYEGSDRRDFDFKVWILSYEIRNIT